MYLAGSTYWNMVYGTNPDEIKEDKEGLQAIKNLCLNMSFAIKALDIAKKQGLKTPELSRSAWTSFIR